MVCSVRGLGQSFGDIMHVHDSSTFLILPYSISYRLRAAHAAHSSSQSESTVTYGA